VALCFWNGIKAAAVIRVNPENAVENITSFFIIRLGIDSGRRATGKRSYDEQVYPPMPPHMLNFRDTFFRFPFDGVHGATHATYPSYHKTENEITVFVLFGKHPLCSLGKE